MTVRTINKRIGNHYPDCEPVIFSGGIAQVVHVDPSCVTFHFTQYSDERYVEPLRRIELDWDARNDRRLFVVRGE